MQKLTVMGCFKRRANVAQDREHLRWREALLRSQRFAQGRAFQQLHHEKSTGTVCHTEIINGDDVWMCKAGCDPSLLPEAFRCFRAADQVFSYDLYGDTAFQLGIRRRVDCSHTTAAQAPLQPVSP